MKSIEFNRMSNVEIERKFLVRDIPEGLDAVVYQEISQGYIAISQESVFRLRHVKEGEHQMWFLTVKSGTGIEHPETEVILSRDQFEKLWPLTEGKRLTKCRYMIPIESGATAQLDIYAGNLAELATVEVEFASLNDAHDFIPPDWFGREVSGQSEYTNASLSTIGLPK